MESAMVKEGGKNFSFAKAGMILLGLTLVSKFLAFGRELAIAAYFGSNADTDSFFIANGLIANVVYGLSTALAVAFLPVYIEEKTKKGKIYGDKFAGRCILFFFLISIVISVLLCIVSDPLVKIIAPSVSMQQGEQISFFIRILSAGLIFSLLNSFTCSLLDAERIFGYSAFSGIIYNATVIVTAVFFSRIYGIVALVVAVAGAHVLQFALSGWRSRGFISFHFPLKNDPRLWNMLLISLPILLSNTTVEINQVINRALAVQLGKGVVSAFSYASTLSMFVTSTLVYSLVTIFFTEFSRVACSEDGTEKIKNLLRSALNILFLLLLPLTLISVFFTEDIVFIALKRGRFSADDVLLTAQGLRYLVIGFVGIVCKALFTKCFISMKDTRSPMMISIGEVCLNIILALILYQKFQIAGITAALAGANILAALTLFGLLHHKLGGGIIHWSSMYVVKISSSAAAAVVVLFLIHMLRGWNAWLRFPLAALAGFAAFIPVYLAEFRRGAFKLKK